MSKTAIKIVCVSVAAAALALGSVVAVSAASANENPIVRLASEKDGGKNWTLEEITTRILNMENRNRVEAVLTRLADLKIISQGEANQILKAWDEAHPDWKSPLEQITARVIEMQNRNRVEVVLNRLVDAGRISRGEANQIIKAWDEAHPDWQSPLERISARVMGMENRNRVVAVLDKLVNGKIITQGEANQILKDWDAAHPDWLPPAPKTVSQT